MTTQVTKTIIVKGDVSEIYDLWADFENFPHFMKNLEDVKRLNPTSSQWTLKGPLGTELTWTAEMTRMEKNKRIAWSSKDAEGTVTTSGQVTFNQLPDDQVEVTALVQYGLPGGTLGDAAAKLFSNPEKRVQEELRNFKSFAEGALQEQG